jgi:hypothetical protein
MRRAYSNYCITASLMVCSALSMAVCFAQAQRGPAALRSAAGESLRQFLLQNLDHDKTTRYIAVFRDLNGDGTPEAIVYLVSNEWCGSGGCNTFILVRDANTWRIVTSITVTRPPIRVLTNRVNGWLSIGVWVQGGGILRGYEAELCFDGRSYPSSPSLPPARRLDRKVAGLVVIPSIADAVPLRP